ncbi:hypothetical protein PLESTF_001679000 [Pleodorina starrii]|nr:hypothetical protein PLESTF_001679000 [Pleodorina starrii]
MAPECFDPANSVITHKVDMFAFGVLLGEMLSGRPPWPGLDMLTIACAVALRGQRPGLMKGLPPGRCPPKLHRLVEGCWEEQPERRPAAAEAVKTLMLVRLQLQQEQQQQQ